VRRLLAFIPSLLAITLLIGLLIDLIPGDPVQLMLGQEASQSSVARERAALGLDRPIYFRLAEWTFNALRGDLGESYFIGKPVSQIIAERYQVTVSLTLFALVIATLVGMCAGIIASINQGGLIDWIVTTSALLWLSFPDFFVALGLIFLFGIRLRWFPITGYVSPVEEGPIEFLKHLFLPAIALGLGYSGVIARYVRTSMLEVLRMDYVTTARAKGLRERVVLLRHTLKNALIPIITAIGIGFGSLLGGAVVVEVVFTMSGVGRMIVDAVIRRDYPLVQGGLLIVAASYLSVNLLVDLFYAWADPRIRYE
jgi:peptide/nickel transport system permease protein